jgi:hypothetical protein
MDIAFDTGTVRTHGSTFFNVFLFGKTEQFMIDQ